MATLIKISDAGAMGLHAAVYLAANPEWVCPAGEMASALQVSAAHLVKVLQRLTRAGLVRADRGPNGGYALARPPERVNLRDVLEAIEGRLAPAACLLKHKTCQGRPCILGGLVQAINRQTIEYLTAKTLGALAVAGWRSEKAGRVKTKKKK
ncbi:MAG: Rrf2 family transcriptional regulator [Kiritimatiellae bacterium]|nr:Rrf2 family transcriptional regulator [Kiritimatiellia bacterium]